MRVVRRPDDDESLPGVWGLPAASLGEGESEVGGILGIAGGEGYAGVDSERAVDQDRAG